MDQIWRDIVAKMTVEERLRGLTVEERLRGLTVVQIFGF
jgi:hypothetical protein